MKNSPRLGRLSREIGASNWIFFFFFEQASAGGILFSANRKILLSVWKSDRVDLDEITEGTIESNNPPFSFSFE